MSALPKPAKLRCAIYTRKSSEEGLDQAFNSLQAQREACEAYVRSQLGEGWLALPRLYDDGGFSGGSMERPGLRQLLADIEEGRVDVVVVYKVDRLTRSLSDFARIVEAFDRKGVSFVSVTQAFNTTTSMGRLTLNVLLSFAQFEREVTGERIRDKIAASKAKGMWMGGVPPLGYDLPTDLTTRALIVNPSEAEVARGMFEKYLELGSVNAVRQWLIQQHVVSKVFVSSKGLARGGAPYSRGALFHMLKNRTYRGQIVHKDKTFAGAHPAIIEEDLFEAVQASLAAGARRRKEQPTRVSTMMLTGLIFDDEGQPMSPTFGHGSKGQVYRYYVSAPLQQGQRRGADDEGIRRVPAPAIEGLVTPLIERLSGGVAKPDLRDVVHRVEVHPHTVQVVVARRGLFPRSTDAEAEVDMVRRRLLPGERVTNEGEGGLLRVTLPCRLKLRGGRVWAVGAEGGALASSKGGDPTLIKGLKAAHGHIARLAGVPLGALDDLQLHKAPDDPYKRMIARLAFLAPDIQAAILNGDQPRGLTLNALSRGDIPVCWEDQRRVFGFKN